MKRRLNILCTLVFVVLLLSMAESVYAVLWGAIEGGKAGMGASSSRELLNLHPINVFPNDMTMDYADSIFNATTGERLPICYSQAAVVIHMEELVVLQLSRMLGAWIILICAVLSIMQFVKFVRNINRADIFSWNNVKRLRKLGLYLLLVFSCNIIIEYMNIWQTSQALSIPGYSFNWLHPLSESSLLLSVLAFIFAEIFAIGLRMKEEQDLTI